MCHLHPVQDVSTPNPNVCTKIVCNTGQIHHVRDGIRHERETCLVATISLALHKVFVAHMSHQGFGWRRQTIQPVLTPRHVCLEQVHDP